MIEPTISLMSNPNAPQIIREIYNGQANLALVPLAAAFLFLIVMICIVSLVLHGSDKRERRTKTKKYREVVTDMYVTGAIRKFAQEDSINLDDEYKRFVKWNKKGKLEDKDLDYVVEDNLNEKVSAKVEAEVENIEK